MNILKKKINSLNHKLENKACKKFKIFKDILIS